MASSTISADDPYIFLPQGTNLYRNENGSIVTYSILETGHKILVNTGTQVIIDNIIYVVIDSIDSSSVTPTKNKTSTFILEGNITTSPGLHIELTKGLTIGRVSKKQNNTGFITSDVTFYVYTNAYLPVKNKVILSKGTCSAEHR